MMLHVAGPFKKKFREFEQPWHIKRFDSVRQEILEQEPDILSDKPENERVHSSPLARPACELVRTLARMLPSRALFLLASLHARLPRRTSTWHTLRQCCSRRRTISSAWAR